MPVVNAFSIVRGTNDKPVASRSLIEVFNRISAIDGQLLIGYPIIGSPEGPRPIDAVYISPTKGVVVIDLVEGTELGDYQDRQDDAATRVQQRLLGYRHLVRRRNLLVDITSLTYAPAVAVSVSQTPEEGYDIADATTLPAVLDGIEWRGATSELYERTLSAFQNISTLRRRHSPRPVDNGESRGARLQRLESSIATLDSLQSKAVIETVDGVQRIRGLAGSGKTIVLALKAAYLHAQHPNWRIAVTFSTRSLKAQFRSLINSFAIESMGEEPNWTNVRIVNSWGAPGGEGRDGIYYEYCTRNGATYSDFNSAMHQYGRDNAFEGACTTALAEVSEPKELYDAILVDEAQDLPPAFLRMCYSMLDAHRRLVYAYDELQNLSGDGLPSVDSIFGTDSYGRPVVSFQESTYDLGARRDIVLEKCYRNSRPVLASAHALGFGIYRRPVRPDAVGLVQMFDQPSLWTDIGYEVTEGRLEPGAHVALARTEASSPAFLEDHSPFDDLIQFIRFPSQNAQNRWVTDQIKRNLTEDELRYDDIIVINTDPVRTRANLGPIRKALLDLSIPNHLAGVDAAADTFFQPGTDSITFTGIHRAKGNEAGMVYIVNADECQAASGNLAKIRNRLFTAITRSKAWVRVLGVGPRMDELIAEYNSVRDANFALSFDYPTEEQRGRLEIIHRDVTQAEAKVISRRRESAESLLDDLESGRLYREDLDPEVLERLSRILRGSGPE